jgi:SAM-dependent methyltransferase
VVATWDSFYSEPASVSFHIRNLYTHLPLFEAVAAVSPRQVLEVGVGTGGMGLFLASLGISVVGVDTDEGVLDRARLLGSNVATLSYELADALRLAERFGPDRFDVAFSQGLFEHFDDEDIRSLLSSQLAVASRAVFSVPSDFYPQQDLGDERLLSLEEWRSILEPFPTAVVSHYGHAVVRDEPEPMHVLAVIDRG